MRKIAFAALALMGVFCASATEDSFLYWMVSNSAMLDNQEIDGTYNAKVVAIEGKEWVYNAGGNYLYLYGDMTDQQHIGQVATDLGPGNNLQYFAKIGSAGSGWTYFIELYHDNAIFARSDGIPYSEEAMTTLINGTTPPTAKLWNVASFVPAAVPEPSSGLLLILGVAGLALRRRKQIAA